MVWITRERCNRLSTIAAGKSNTEEFFQSSLDQIMIKVDIELNRHSGSYVIFFFPSSIIMLFLLT